MNLIPIPNAPLPRQGLNFCQYFPLKNFSYAMGVIQKVAEGEIVVDFGDMVISFCRDDIRYVINDMFGDEHFMTIATGVIVTQY